MEQRMVIFGTDVEVTGSHMLPEVQEFINEGWKIDKFTAVYVDKDTLNIIILFVR